nr:protease inhibitor I42 family protein [Paenibacillus oenotherae]
MKEGEQLQIVLYENASTGYTWLEEVAPEQNMILLGHEEHAGDPGSPGASGARAWTYTASAAGQRTIRFHYQRPWLHTASRSFEITVQVLS